MARTVHCVVLNEERRRSGEITVSPVSWGQRIYENVSSEGWQQWLERLTTIINENGLTTADTEHIELIEKHMRGFFFAEGDYGQLPAGYQAGGGSKK